MELQTSVAMTFPNKPATPVTIGYVFKESEDRYFGVFSQKLEEQIALTGIEDLVQGVRLHGSSAAALAQRLEHLVHRLLVISARGSRVWRSSFIYLFRPFTEDRAEQRLVDPMPILVGGIPVGTIYNGNYTDKSEWRVYDRGNFKTAASLEDAIENVASAFLAKDSQARGLVLLPKHILGMLELPHDNDIAAHDEAMERIHAEQEQEKRDEESASDDSIPF